MINKTKYNPYTLIGWREWCALPELDIPLIKAKIDTGAKTSALHADNIQIYHRRGATYAKFQVQPLQNNHHVVINCHAKVVDERSITSSNGKKELRYIIESSCLLGDVEFPIELSLTNRDLMRFRLLLGRDALQHDILINPSKSHQLGKYTKLQAKRFYK